MTKKEEKKKVVPQRNSVHVVFFSCENCGEEIEHIQFCPDCGKPMRVIDVVEKFGEDAEEFIKKVEDRLGGVNSTESKVDDIGVEEEEEVSNVIVLGEDEHIEDGVVEDVNTLDDIFPDDDSEDIKPSNGDDDLSDLDDIVAELDKEDDDFSMDDFGDEGLPEL